MGDAIILPAEDDCDSNHEECVGRQLTITRRFLGAGVVAMSELALRLTLINTSMSRVRPGQDH